MRPHPNKRRSPLMLLLVALLMPLSLATDCAGDSLEDDDTEQSDVKEPNHDHKKEKDTAGRDVP